jgi:hypothetical protein
VKCTGVIQPTGDRCTKDASHVVQFNDGQKTMMCISCAIAMQQMALSHNTRIKVEKHA